MEHDALRTRLWAWYLAVAVFAGQYYVVSGYGATTNDTLATIIGASGLVAAVIGLGVHRPRRWVAPALVTASIAGYLAADAVLTDLEADNVIVPFPSLADWLYLAVYPVLVVAFLLVGCAAGFGLARPAAFVGVITTLATGAGLWWLYGGELWSSPFFFDETQRRVAVAYPLADAVLVGSAVALLVLAARRSAQAVLLAAAGASVVVGNAVYNVDALGAGHETGGVASVGWMAFTVLLGGAVLHPAIAERTRADQAVIDTSEPVRPTAIEADDPADDAERPARELVGV